MAETSRIWDGSTEGHAVDAPYSADEFRTIISLLAIHDRTLQDVLYTKESAYDGMLGVTNPAGLTIRTAEGVALVDGTLYINTANVDKSMAAAPGAGFNGYRLVLQKSWAAQTVRIVLLGPDVGAYPVLTQTDGVTWEISLATITQNPASVVIQDDRNYFNLIDPLFHKTSAGVDTEQSSILVQSGSGAATFGGASDHADVAVTMQKAYYTTDYIIIVKNIDLSLHIMNTLILSESSFRVYVSTADGSVPVVGTLGSFYWIAVGQTGEH